MQRFCTFVAAASAAFAVSLSGQLHAADPKAVELKFSDAQLKSLGIAVAPLSARSGVTLAGLPAQVVIPAQQLFVVSAPLAGLVEQVGAAAQQEVRRGQLLVRLQSPALAEAQRSYVQSRTQADLARRNLERDEKLLAEGIIAESRFLTTRSQNNEAQVLLAERRQALRLAGVPESAVAGMSGAGPLGSALSLVSPTDGLVLEQLVQPGQRVEAATPLYKVARLDPLWLEIQVPAAQSAGLKAGAAVRVASPPAGGKVISVGRIVNAGSQTVLVRAAVSVGAGQLQPGQFVEASVAQDNGAKLWAVPTAAIVRQGNKALVFVRTVAGFRPETVKVESEGATESVVSGAIRDGEQVAVKGVAAIKAAMMGIGVE